MPARPCAAGDVALTERLTDFETLWGHRRVPATYRDRDGFRLGLAVTAHRAATPDRRRAAGPLRRPGWHAGWGGC